MDWKFLYNRVLCFIFLCLTTGHVIAQASLPPTIPWSGKSEALVAKANDPWITACEKSGFAITPNYEETMAWLKKLCAASPLLHMVSIGTSVEGRSIYMIIASTEKNIQPAAIRLSKKPCLLAQAGIHSGEIDGKDAGMMLLRDIAFGSRKSLLNDVNFLFIPILSVDAHEHSSPFNRPNQRGPANMGWRTNAKNLNLNRDYAKLDTREIRAVVKVINEYEPSLYMDIHVTDGADYQYDITFGGLGEAGYSKGISHWLATSFKPAIDKDLITMGHIPGPLLNALNERDFSDGNIATLDGPRFSDSYGDLRHLPTVLIENHSLKPYKQRVLGTYVLLESTLKLLVGNGQQLKKITAQDKAVRAEKIPSLWKVPQFKSAAGFDDGSLALQPDSKAPAPDSLQLSGITSVRHISPVTNATYVEWLGKPITTKVPDYHSTEGIIMLSRPKGYWIPAAYEEVIERLKCHGIQMTTLAAPREILVEMYRVKDVAFGNESQAVQPFEGHMQVTANTSTEIREQVFARGSVFVPTDQPLGDLAMMLLEPASKDSFFRWGFFLEIFQRTEYIEAYVMEPLAKKMLDASPALQKEFEEKKAADKEFASDANAILTWFYSKTKYYDDRYLLYPVGRVL